MAVYLHLSVSAAPASLALLLLPISFMVRENGFNVERIVTLRHKEKADLQFSFISAPKASHTHEVSVLHKHISTKLRLF